MPAAPNVPKHSKPVKSRAQAEGGNLALIPVVVDMRHLAGLDVEPVVRAVLEKTLESVHEVRRRSGSLEEGDLLREVGATLLDKAEAAEQVISAEDGWQELLERGFRSKVALLRSNDFKSVAQVSELLGIGEPAVRRRIRERKLFSLSMPGDGEYRIPAWALDPNISGKTTTLLLDDAQGASEWHVYHFLTTPCGSLNGLRPFECLLSRENLPPSRQAVRGALLEYFRMDPDASLLEPVRKALRADLQEGANA